MTETDWNFYLSSERAWEAMRNACALAESTIDIEQFIFADDEIGKSFVEVLIERSRKGVRIRLLCDMVGSYSLYNSETARRLIENGIEVRFFNIISPWRVTNFFSWFFRDHRKILVIDNEVGFTGGVGIRLDMKSWRDTHVRVHGPMVREMKYAFNELWDHAIDKDIFSRIKKAKTYVPGFHFITNSPYFRKRFLYHALIDSIRSARKYVYLTTPYFVPDGRLLRVLRLAVRRGVEVKILLPQDANVPWVETASEAHFEMLLKAGVKIFRYKDFFHTKTAVIDDEWATVGSFNLDSLSFLYNYEANIVSTDSVFVQAIKSHFVSDLEKSKEVYLKEWLARPFIQKFKEYVILPFRGLL